MVDSRAAQAAKIGTYKTPAVKIPDLYNIESGTDTIPESVMEYLLFEQVGGQELLSLSRTDTVSGTNPSYSIITDLINVGFQNSASSIISLPNSLPDTFKQYGIVLGTYVPDIEEAYSNPSQNGYIDSDQDNLETYQSLIFEFKNMQKNHQIEVQVMVTGSENYTNQGLV